MGTIMQPVGEVPQIRGQFVAAEAVEAIFRNAPPVDSARFRSDVDSWVRQETASCAGPPPCAGTLRVL
jgi:hypothetical protein